METADLALTVSAIAAVIVAAAHSFLGELKILRPLYENRGASSALSIAGARRVVRAVWHMPSFIWAATGIVTYGFVYHGTTPPGFFVIYACFVYLVGAIGNAWSLRKIHIGSLLLALAAAALLYGKYFTGQ